MSQLRSSARYRADLPVAGDASCLLHIGGILSRQQSGIRVMHLAEVLASTEDEPALVVTP